MGAVNRMIRKAAGEAVCLVDAGERTERFDILAPLVATDGAIHDLGMDHSHATSHCGMMAFSQLAKLMSQARCRCQSPRRG
jgi:hypothetical protein